MFSACKNDLNKIPGLTAVTNGEQFCSALFQVGLRTRNNPLFILTIASINRRRTRAATSSSTRKKRRAATMASLSSRSTKPPVFLTRPNPVAMVPPPRLRSLLSPSLCPLHCSWLLLRVLSDSCGTRRGATRQKTKPRWIWSCKA